MNKLKSLIGRCVLLFVIMFFNLTFSQSISWNNPISSAEPGESISVNLTYDAGAGNDFYYIAIRLQELNASGGVVKNYNVIYPAGNLAPNSGTINTSYTVDSGVALSSGLPAGNYYFLKVFMSINNDSGFRNDSKRIVIEPMRPVLNKKVRVILNAKHSVGGEETFDRRKYINIHANQNEAEWDGNNNGLNLRDDFLNGLDVYLGRDTGGITSNLNQVNEDPARLGYASSSHMVTRGVSVKNNYASKTAIHQYESRNDLILAAQFKPFWTGTGQVATKKGWTLVNGEATGEYMGRYINNFHGGNGQPVPALVEVINEPAYDLLGGAQNFTNSILEIANFHNDVAVSIKNEVPSVKVGGYTTAFPNFEKGDFQRWNNRWKLFMDTAGANMDFWSIHLYDIASKTDGTIDLRSGSNIEATFDMMEQYSKMSFNAVKPFVISEFGAQMNGHRNTDWSPYRDWLYVKSASSQLMSFLERPNYIEKAIPFIVVKAIWGSTPDGNSYNNRLMRQENEPTAFVPGYAYSGKWVYSDMVKFYQLWSDVKGTRVDVVSSDLDIQVDAYVDGNKAYVILNNLNFSEENVDLTIVDNQFQNISSIRKKHLYLDNVSPVLLDEILPVNTTSVVLGAEATMILEYTLAGAISINEENQETKYYATTYLKPIVANQSEVFHVNDISKSSFGEAVLRIGVGRQHNKILKPIVEVNNTIVSVPDNWRGYDQAQRERFFGVLEIPVPYSLLHTNNTVDVKFPDSGGHISTVTMQVFNFTSDIRSLGTSDLERNSFRKKINVYPNPTRGVFNISNIEAGKTLDVYNLSGVKVMELTVGQNMDVSKLASGVYFLRTNDGNISRVVKY